MGNSVQEVLQSLYETCDSIDEMKLESSSFTPLRQILKDDFINFLMYLSAADGTISWKEAQFINSLFFTDLDSSTINKRIISKNLYSISFESKVPESLDRFVAADNTLASQDSTINSGALVLCDAFDAIGKAFLACDDNSTESEVSDLTTYINHMKEYFIKEDCLAKGATKSNQLTIDIVDNQKSTLDQLLYELDSLTGLDAVKKDVNSLINLLQIRKIREERGLKQPPISLHLVFSGNPGTGKTTVARLLAQIYCKIGVLSKGQLVETDRSGLVGGYVGQTALKVHDVVEKALGGVLFIDEAYSLTVGKGDNDYGNEAVETLIKSMEDHRNDLIVIVAGYPDLMNVFLKANPGLRSRFNKFIIFEDYKPEELYDIFRGFCIKSGYQADEECSHFVKDYFVTRYLNRDENYANARDVRNFFEIAIINQANRLITNRHLTDEELATLTLDDVKSIIL